MTNTVTTPLRKHQVITEQAPLPVGPYSQAIRVENLLFLSGQVPIDPATGKLLEGDIATQTKQVLQNLNAVLEETGASLANVVKTTVFLTNFDHFAAMNKIYAEFFTAAPPARSTVEVSRLPLGALVEIEAIAIME